MSVQRKPTPKRLTCFAAHAGVYHYLSRCVRRAFLCGSDKDCGDFSHRKARIVDRLCHLAAVLALEVCALIRAAISIGTAQPDAAFGHIHICFCRELAVANR